MYASRCVLKYAVTDWLLLVETVEPVNDRSLESWTDCPNFTKHVQAFRNSDEFKQKEQKSQAFFGAARDFVFGRETSLNNIVCLISLLVILVLTF